MTTDWSYFPNGMEIKSNSFVDEIIWHNLSLRLLKQALSICISLSLLDSRNLLEEEEKNLNLPCRAQICCLESLSIDVYRIYTIYTIYALCTTIDLYERHRTSSFFLMMSFEKSFFALSILKTLWCPPLFLILCSHLSGLLVLCKIMMVRGVLECCVVVFFY